MAFSICAATLVDVPALERLIDESARGLCSAEYTDDQIAAALGSAWGVDTELIRDGTYFVAEDDGEIIACGGWSRRGTLFGGDRYAERQSMLLVPGVDAARIRAFFVRPNRARQGIGRALLERCEIEAQAHGFRRAELVATLTGQKLYRAFGYMEEKRGSYPLPGGVLIEFVSMRKSFAAPERSDHSA